MAEIGEGLTPGAPQEQAPTKKEGIEVVVENPQFIFAALSRPDPDFTDLLIQKDGVHDALFTTLEARASTTGADSRYRNTPGWYDFSATLHTEGGNASISKFTKGYVTEEQQAALAQYLAEHGFTEIVLASDPRRRDILCEFQGNEYSIDMGFGSYQDKQAWFDEKIEKERMSIRRNDYLSSSIEMRKEIKNRNMRIYSVYHEMKERGDDPEQNFAEDLTKFARVYETALKGIYAMYEQTEPQKTLVLSNSHIEEPPMLQLVK